MVNNINEIGLSKLNNVFVKNVSGETREKILEEKPDSIIIHAGTNDLTNNINSLNSVKKLDALPAIKIAFSSIVLRRDRRNINESRADFDANLRNFCKQKNIGFIDNENT